MAETERVARLGAGGDGVIERDAGPVFVPFGLPGERVRVAGGPERADLLEVVEPSPERAEPFCPYFGRCGGCAAQHMGPGLYDAWKTERLRTALARAGLPAGTEPLVDAHGAGRRRVTFHARTSEEGTKVGFMEARSHRLVPVARCPITVPALRDAPAAATALAEAFRRTGKPLDIGVTATTGGLDIDLRGAGPQPEKTRQALVRLAEMLDLARLSLHGDLLVERRPPEILCGTVRVKPPPGGFLQATAAGEAILAEAVAEGVGPARRVLDLFAGIGPFSLRLARGATVHAVDGSAPALAALDRAARGASGLRGVTTETRDLFRRPLLPPELDRFDAVVLDPPRAGAEAQVRQLIPSSPDVVIMVSCDPVTFARDAALLAGGGFALGRVLPVDQFKWSAHLEVVGVFRRARTGGKARRRPGRL